MYLLSDIVFVFIFVLHSLHFGCLVYYFFLVHVLLFNEPAQSSSVHSATTLALRVDLELPHLFRTPVFILSCFTLGSAIFSQCASSA